MDRKIKSQKEIIGLVKSLKKNKKKVVTYCGSFDMLHAGHVGVIKEAKKQGDVLVILLNTDESVRMYKGPHRPINSEAARAEMLAGLADVDYVVFFNEMNPKEILEKIKPDVHCSGSDWGRYSIERSVVEKHGGKIHVLKFRSGFSTSGMIKKILDVYNRPEVKAVFLDRDGTINVNDPEYIHKIEDFKFTPGTVAALKKLSKSDYRIIVVTNQSGIARGYYQEKDMHGLHAWMVSELDKKGARIDKIYHCPHGPMDTCLCRKPGTGMALRAVKDFGINLSKSWMVGDDPRDIIMGREANLKTIKIGGKMPRHLKLEPSHYVQNLSEAVNIILS